MDADLHLKMSKKIAQLTKVIFHLNTKNEDAAMELQATVYSHRKENEMLAKEAAAKMAQLKESLDKREAQLKSMENVKKIKERHQKDKAETLDEFKRYKDDVKAHQARVEEQFHAELETMGSELRKARAAFQERVASLKTALEAVQSKATHGQADLVAMRAKHTDEVADMVTQSNKKFNDMLTSQLNQQDQLRAEHAAKVAALEKAHHFQLQQVTEKADQDVKSAVRRRELECNSSADSMKNDMVAKMERLLSEIETLRTSETQLRTDKSELQQQLTSLRASMKQVEIELHNEKRTAQTLLQSADAALTEAKANLAERQTQLALLETELAKLRSQAEAMDGERRQLQKTIDKLQSEHQSTSSSLSEKEKQWGVTVKALELEVDATKKQLKDKTADVQKLQSLIKSMEAQHAKSEDEIKTQLLAAQKKSKELHSSVAAATAREDALLKQLDACQTELKQAHGDKAATTTAFEATQVKLNSTISLLQEEVRGLKQRELDLIAEHERAVQKLHQAAQSTSQSQQAEMEKRLQEVQTQLVQLKAQLAAAQEALSTSQNLHAQLLDQQKKSLSESKAMHDQLKQAEIAHEKAQKDWDKQLAALGAEKDKAAKRAAKDKATIDKLEGDLKVAKQQAEMSGRKHADALAALAAQHDTRLQEVHASTAATIQDAVTKAEAVMQQHVDEQRAFLLAMHKTEVADVQGQVELWRQKLTDQQDVFDNELRSQLETHAATCAALELEHRNERSAAEAAWQDKVDAMTSRHDETVRHMDAAHVAETASIKASFNHQINAAIAQASAERDQLLSKHAQEVQKLNEARQNELAAAASDLARKLADLREKKDHEHRVATAALAANHGQVVAKLEDTVESCSQTIARHVGSLLALEGDKKSLQRTITEKEAELVQKELLWQREKDHALELARKHHKVELEQTIEMHLHETQALNTQFDKTRALLHEQQQQLVGKIREWENVYARRDSRLEDLNRIADLEHDVAEKDALVQQTVEEMAYIKRELLNREDTYNKTFGRSPNVGVLQVLKPAPPPPNAKLKKTKTQSGMAAPSNNAAGSRPLPPIGANQQQSSSYRDLNQT